MAFTGLLGTDDSQLGQIILGQEPQAQQQQGGGSVGGDMAHWVDGLPAEGVSNPTRSTSGLAFWVDGLVSEGMFTAGAAAPPEPPQFIEASDSGQGSDNATASADVPAGESGQGNEDGVVGVNAGDNNNSVENSPGPDVFVFSDDSGHGEDTTFLNNASFTMTDTGQGLEIVTVTASILAEDSGSGNEDVIVGINGADAGSSLDNIPNVDVVALASDSGQSNDNVTTTADISASDSGSGSETGIIGIVVSDSGVGSDEATVSVVILVTDEGHGEETLDIPERTIIITDEGHGEDFVSTTASLLVTDGNIDPDIVTIGIIASDEGQGNEAGTPGIMVGDSGGSSENNFFGDNQTSVHDFGFGLDLVDRQATALSGTFTDEGHGEEFAYISLSLLDSGAGTDTATVSALIQASDEGHGEDTPVNYLTAQDSGQGSDELFLNVIVTDFGSGTESYIQLDKSEAGPCFDEGHALEIATSPDFTSFCSFGPETLLPTWHRGRADTTSLVWNFLQIAAFMACPLNEDVSRVKLLQRLPSAQVRETRMLWVAKFAYSVNEDLHVQYIGTDGVSGLARRAATQADFESATDPVWIGDFITKTIKMRNLMMKEAQLVSDTGVYSISDSVGLVPDVGVYWRIQDKHPFRWVDPEGPDYNGSNLTFTLPYKGNITARYGSQAVLDSLASGSVVFYWAGGQSIELPLVRSSQPNIFDGYGVLLGMKRIRAGELEEEDNLSFKQRMLIEILSPPNSTLDGVVRGIASRLDQLESTEWDGITPLNLDTTGASAITSVKVVSVDRLREISESLTPATTFTTKFYATESGWRPGYIVFLDGVPQPNVSVSGNLVTLQTATSGAVDAEYSVEHYTISSDPSGNILTLDPGTGLPSGSYKIVYSRNVRAYVVDLPETQKTKLLLSDGNPNQLFLEIAGLLTEGNPTTFGRARWGANAYWFTREEDRPGVARLPVTFDAND